MPKIFKWQLFFSIIAMLVTVSCSENEMATGIDKPLPEQETNIYKISEEEAKETLYALLNQFDSNPAGVVSTRNFSSRTIANVQAYRVDKQKVLQVASEVKKNVDLSKIDTLMYLMNFENNEGFAFVSADKRSKSRVLAIIDSGDLSLDALSMVDNPGFVLFFNQAITHTLQEIAGIKKEEEEEKK